MKLVLASEFLSYGLKCVTLTFDLWPQKLWLAHPWVKMNIYSRFVGTPSGRSWHGAFSRPKACTVRSQWPWPLTFDHPIVISSSLPLSECLYQMCDGSPSGRSWYIVFEGTWGHQRPLTITIWWAHPGVNVPHSHTWDITSGHSCRQHTGIEIWLLINCNSTLWTLKPHLSICQDLGGTH